MAAVEVIYVLAAVLWIVVVLAALCLGLRFMVKLRAERRRINRILCLMRMPLRLYIFQESRSQIRGNMNQLLSAVVAEARRKGMRGSRQTKRRARRGL